MISMKPGATPAVMAALGTTDASVSHAGAADRRMAYVSLSAGDVFDAMDLSRPGLEAVRMRAAAGDWPGAEEAWGRYWASRESPRHVVDDQTYVRGVNAHLPEVRRMVLASAAETMSDAYQHSTYKPERDGRSFQWIDDNPDGAQLEQCPQYHVAGMRDITRALMVLHANGLDDISRDPELWRRLERIYDYPVRITHPTGHLAVFNSGVYGTEAQVFFPIGARLFHSDLQAWATRRYVRPGFVPVAKNLSESIMVMDGAWAEAVAEARQREVAPPAFTSELLRDSGLAVLRSGWDDLARPHRHAGVGLPHRQPGSSDGLAVNRCRMHLCLCGTARCGGNRGPIHRA